MYEKKISTRVAKETSASITDTLPFPDVFLIILVFCIVFVLFSFLHIVYALNNYQSGK